MTEDQLARSLDALNRLPVDLGWDDVERHLTDDTTSLPESRRSRRGRSLWVVAVVASAAAVIALIVVRSDGPSDPIRTGPSQAPGRTTDLPSDTGSTESGPTTTAPATRSDRTLPVTAMTDDEYLVWGGEAGDNDVSARVDGFSVDLRSGAVSPIPTAPVDPRSGAAGVWTGSELIVCCGTGQADGFPFDTRSAAAWNPASGEWRLLAAPPDDLARSYPAAVWTGGLMVVIAPGPAVATYDPATDSWSSAPAPPMLDRLPSAIWTGSEVILWDARMGSGHVPPDGAVADRGWRWAPGGDAWQPLPDLPSGSRTQLGSIAWTGSEVVVWGESIAEEGVGVGARWRPGDGSWKPMAASPEGRVDAFDGTPGSQTLVADHENERVLIRALEGGDVVPPLYIYDPSTDRWTATDLVVPGYHPPLEMANGVLYSPDQDAPIVGSVND